MLRRPRERATPEIPVASMADVAFLLIVYFMVTTSFTKATGLKLEVPAAKKTAQKTMKKNITVTLSPGKIFISTGTAPREVKMVELHKLLKEELASIKEPKKRIIVLECREKVSYQQYIEVVDTIQQAGGILTVVEYE